MSKFSELSLSRLKQCHPDLQKVFYEVEKHIECTVLCGYRGEKEQNDAYNGGFSKLKYPKSKHNLIPSRAIDVAIYPINWKNRDSFIYFAGFVMGIAKQLGVKIRCGVDFNSNLDFKDDSLFDGPHFELVD